MSGPFQDDMPSVSKRSAAGAERNARPMGRRAALVAIGLAGLLVAGCTPTDFSGPGFSGGRGGAAPEPVGEVIGGGDVKVALLLPLSANGNAASLAKTYRNTAELAIRDLANPNIRLIVKDSRGTAEGAAAAASQAVAEGAELILGPVFSHEVAAAGNAARQAGVPVIGFSSDVKAAASGTYLMSFLPRSDVARIVSYATSQGRRSFAAIVPANAYGAVIEAELQQAVARSGARILAIGRYGGDSPVEQAVASVAAVAAGSDPQVDAILIPDGANASAIAAKLTAAGVSTARVKLLGSGQWANAARSPTLDGAWYPAPDNSGYNAFAGRYRSAYGTAPIRIASNAYDAVILAAALARTAGTQRYSEAVLTNPNGFSGVDGIFRFRKDGTNDRGLAVYEVNGGSGRLIAPAPTSFTGSS